MNKINLFLDDERQPPTNHFLRIATNDWEIVRSYDEAVQFVLDNGLDNIGFISFDHDLGYGKTGMDFAKFIVEHALDNNIDMTDFEFYAHSMNPIGRKNITDYLNGFLESIRK